MPTGYTSKLYDGEQTFEEFLFSCARAFGALVTMRDDPSDAPIPDELEASTSYYDDSIDEAHAELRRLDTMSVEQAKHDAWKEYSVELQRRADEAIRRKAIRERYEAMIEQVAAWEPPTADHIGLAEFMLKQLRESIDFDTRTYEGEMPPTDPQKWVEKKRADAERRLAYGVEQREKELERTRGRNAWIKALRDSIAPVEAR